MKRRWRRLILVASTVVLTAFLIVLGLVLWLYQSGRLATLSQDLLQRLSGQDVTLESIEFPAWNTVAFTRVRLQQRLPDWQLTVACPRLEAHYGLTGLLNKRVDSLRLLQPHITLTRRVAPSTPSQLAPASDSQPVAALPVKRLIVQQGNLQVTWDGQVYTLHQIDATLRSPDEQPLQAEVSGRLQDGTASLEMVAHVPLDQSQPAGRLQVMARSVPVSYLTEVFSQHLPPKWNVLQGELDLTANLNLQDGTLQGNVMTTAGQMSTQAQGMSLRQATFSSETVFQADVAQRHLRLQGKAHLQAAKASWTADTVMTKVSFSTEASLEADLLQRTLSIQGQARLQAAHASAAADLTLADVSLSTQATLQASYAQPQTLRLQGQARLQAGRVSQAPATSLSKVSLSAPWRLSRTLAGWQLTATPAFQSHTARVGSRVHASGLAIKTNTPVQIRYGDRGLQVQGTPEVTVETLQIHPAGERETGLRVTALRAHLPLQGSADRVDISAADVQTQTWYGHMPDQTEILKTLSLQGSGSIDLRRQQLAVREVTADLPQLGKMHASGSWHWPSRTIHDLQVRVAPTTVEALKTRLQPWLPAAYGAWQLAGQTDLHLRTARLSLRTPQRVQNLLIGWQLHNGAFSSPDSGIAGEHLNGTLQATASFDQAAGRVSVQGTLTLTPFALLVGSLFPAIEANRITTAVTFSVVYSSATERLQVYLAGQFHDLGMVTVQGDVQQALRGPQIDLRLHLRDLHAARFWNTFLSDPVQFPALSQANVQGKLYGAFELRGQPTALTVQGTLDIADAQVHSGAVALGGMSLVLPIRVHYPLPSTSVQIPAPPPEAYGRLDIETLRIGRVELGGLSLGLRLQSDTVLFRHGLRVPLWGGQIVLESITAQHLLRPQRRIALHMRLYDLDLQRVPRGASKLPLAGVINGDFPLLQIHGDRLETQGALTIAVAGGRVRLFDLQGSDLLSSVPTLRGSMRTEESISLLRLTSIYPIGDIGGTVRFSVTDLVITAGEPAAFSLEFAVQEKDGESREITLRALNNLLFTAGSAKVASNLLGDAQRLPYKRFGVEAWLRNDTLRLRGKYHDQKGIEYFMQAPALGAGVSIVNRVPDNGIPFREFLQRLKATVLEKPSVQVK